MGRGKIEIKRIENSNNRQVTYSKRKNGITKKAEEITVLCDAKVSVIIFASSGKMHHYCSPSTNLGDMMDKYQRLSGKRLWEAKHENLSNEIDRMKKENDNMKIELRRLKGEDITSLNYRDLIAMEDALETGLVHVRDKQMEWYKTKKRHQKMMEEENSQLNFQLQQQEMAMESGFQQTVRDYNAQQLSFAFRMQQQQQQPIPPNRQDRL